MTDSRKPGVGDHRRVGEQQQRRRQPERRRCATRPAALPGKEGDAGHDRRPHHRRRGARRDDVGDHRREDAGRDEPPRSAAQHGRDQAGDDGDVPARDRDHVADPGRGEVGGEGAIHALSQSDQDPRREPGLGLRERTAQRVAARVAQRLEADRRGLRERQRPGLERAGRAGSPEVLAVRVVVGRRPQPAVDRRRGRPPLIAGIGGQRRRDRHLDPVHVEAQPRDLCAVPRRPDGIDDRRPRAAIGREWRRRGGRRSDERRAAQAARLRSRPPRPPPGRTGSRATRHWRQPNASRPATRTAAAGIPFAAPAAAAATPIASQPPRGTRPRGPLTARRSRGPGSCPASRHRRPCAFRAHPPTRMAAPRGRR